jgi:citrate lyase gamma subunit
VYIGIAMNKSENITDALLIKKQFSVELQRLIQDYVNNTGIRITNVSVDWHHAISYKADKYYVGKIYVDCKFG